MTMAELHDLNKLAGATYLNQQASVNQNVTAPSMQNMAFNIPRETVQQPPHVDDINFSNEAEEMSDDSLGGSGWYAGGLNREGTDLLPGAEPQAAYVGIWVFLGFVLQMIAAFFKWVLKLFGLYQENKAGNYLTR